MKAAYHYDIEQRLIEVKAGSSTANLSPEELNAKTTAVLKTLAQSITPQTIVSYAYNGYGQRIKKTSQCITYYLYSQQGLAAEYDSQGNLIVEYHYKPQQTWMTYPIAQNRGGTYYYYQNDHLGTPQRLLKTSGEIMWEGRYTAFGEVTEVKNTIQNNLRFPGQYYDSETNTHYNYYRDYDPHTGRYIQVDPIGLQGGMNTYGYVGGNPIFGIDPYGLYCFTSDEMAGIAGGIGGGVAGAIGGAVNGFKWGGGWGGAFVGGIGGGISGAGAGYGAGVSNNALGGISGVIGGAPAGGNGMGLGLYGAYFGNSLGGGYAGGVAGGMIGGGDSKLGMLIGMLGGLTGAAAEEYLKAHNDCSCKKTD